jgi:xylulokinase
VDPVYANARGAAWIGAVGLGHITFNDVSRLVKFKHVFEPQPENTAIYRERFKIFTRIHRQMKGIYHQLNQSKYGNTETHR